eukprot:TRINITY_DN59644_c0_g3_i1.p1 TRINITY_DN59644_c0_g3~~TRINITY_DN59644_c0_g3_i1.p1  ORF type:complete len:161 (-),score=8.77 TRINITY_DN59644_c0_g3_i1:179-661(-)
MFSIYLFSVYLFSYTYFGLFVDLSLFVSSSFVFFCEKSSRLLCIFDEVDSDSQKKEVNFRGRYFSQFNLMFSIYLFSVYLFSYTYFGLFVDLSLFVSSSFVFFCEKSSRLLCIFDEVDSDSQKKEVNFRGRYFSQFNNFGIFSFGIFTSAYLQLLINFLF